MIKLYVYNSSDGLFLYEYTGIPEHVNYGLLNNKDFTLTQPPNYSQNWYWINDKWQSDSK